MTSQRGSQINSGGDINITAREGDLKVIGSQVDGQNVTLDAAKNLLLQSSQSGMANKQKTESWGAEAGVALTFGNGVSAGFYGAGNVANDKTDQQATTHNETTLNAAKTLTLVSGQDTTLQGAQAQGEKVVAHVGGDLNLISEQDNDKFRNVSGGEAYVSI